MATASPGAGLRGRLCSWPSSLSRTGSTPSITSPRDPSSTKCAVAAAAAHLNATAADDGGTVDVILPVIAVLTEVSQSDPVTSFLSPVQGRAPPTPAG